jgi:hypothetical protein
MTDIMDFLLPMLVLLIIGIIGITFWVAWVIFKARYKDRLQGTDTPSVAPVLPAQEQREPYVLGIKRAPDGSWGIDVEGKRYPTLEAVPDDAIRQDVVAGLKELVAFARSYVQREQAAKKQAQPEPRPVPHPEPPREPARPTMATLKVAPTAALPTAQPAQDKLRVFLKGEPTLKRSDAAPTIMPNLDLAREIGDIVSEMQMKIPSLAQRSIRLQNVPSGGIQFAIDGIVYPDVNEIPDTDIQALIRAATKEWERR